MTADVPRVVYDAEPALVELYDVAWRLAGEHVVSRDGAPASPYLDEGFDPDTVWIWDTCLMAHFAKYAPDQFPGVESLRNFYAPMYDGAATSLLIQHPDNPPLFAWSEEEYARHTGDLEHVRRLLDSRYLQRHLEFFEKVRPGTVLDCSRIPTTIERTGRGYRWNGVCSGMDNTPRAPDQAEGGTDGDVLWFDAAAQQALSARSIAALARLVGDDALAAEYDGRHERFADLVNQFWDDEHGLYVDRVGHEPFSFTGVRTPATYWPLLAGACTHEQAARLAQLLEDPDCFGGEVPWVSVARDDPAFRGTGHYWRGGVWVPMAYVGARALADAGYTDLTRTTTLALLRHMARVYSDYEPASIWECYAPDRVAPSTGKDDEYIVRPDFCGWSALAPISMLLEHVLGLRVDAPGRTVRWRTAGPDRHGVRGLRCGGVRLDAVCHEARIDLDLDGPLTVEVDDRAFDLPAGQHTLRRTAADDGWRPAT